MGEFRIQIPDDVMPDVVAALCDYGGYGRSGPGGPQQPAQTEQQFAKSVVTDFIKTRTKHYKADLAAKEAREQAHSDIEEGLGGIT